MEFFSICCQRKKGFAALTSAAVTSPVSNSLSFPHGCPGDLLPAHARLGTGKRNSQQEMIVPGAGVGDLLGHNPLAKSASVCDPFVSAPR